MKTNIALLGFMGTGKSSVATVLANRLKKTLVETDELVALRAGKTIERIFDEDGESVFRALEAEAIEMICDKEHLIISCGGGVVLQDVNLSRLRRNAVLVVLVATPESIQHRLAAHASVRPLLGKTGRLDRIRALLSARRALYSSAADCTIDTTHCTVREAAQRVLDEVKACSGH